MADPGQKGLADAVIVIPAGRFVLTTIATVLDIAGLPDGHIAFDVRVQVIASPLTGTYVYVGLFPLIALIAFTFH